MTVIRIEHTNKVLSPLGGLLVYSRTIDKLNLAKTIEKVLPKLKRDDKKKQWEKLHCLLVGFIAGAQCLDDVGYYNQDAAFQAVCTVRFAPNTLGEYLRSFDKKVCDELSRELLDVTLRLRNAVTTKKTKEFILALDSTKHEHCGELAEGLEHTHDGRWCLDSLQAYDEKGFQYHFDLRPGTTHTATGAVEAFTNIFARVKQQDKHKKLYFLADSGYCTYDIFNGLFHVGAKFVISLRQQIYNKYADQIQNWRPTKLLSHDGRECEIGSTVFFKEGTHEPIRIVAMRAKRDDGLLSGYDIFDFVTNIGIHEMTHEKIIKLYRKRSNCENFIKESKGGFDLKHFPCKPISANRAYGLIGMLAYNLMRFSALMEDPLHPKFAKLLRFRIVQHACEVVKHGRTVTFRFMTHVAKEVVYWIDKIHNLLTGGIRCLE